MASQMENDSLQETNDMMICAMYLHVIFDTSNVPSHTCDASSSTPRRKIQAMAAQDAGGGAFVGDNAPPLLSAGVDRVDTRPCTNN